MPLIPRPRPASKLYRAVTGEALPKYYRPPRGIYSRENLEMAQALGYRTVFWSLAYVDWKNDDQPSAAMRRTRSGFRST